MYTKVYCILAHKNPTQINELITLLDDGNSSFFIHLDKKISLKKYRKLLQKPSCHFVKKRVSCSWGTYSLVQATLNSMKEVQSYMNFNHENSDYHFIMLSGEDLPLKSNTFIHDFLKRKTDASFINYWELPYGKWWGGGLFRLENFYFLQYKKHPKLNYWINRIIKKLQLNFLFPLNRFKKEFPEFKIYGSSQWMILNKDLVSFVIEKSNKNPDINSIFKYVLAPDELYFSTLIMNYNQSKRFKINNISTHLVLFNRIESSPKYLEIGDLEDNNENLLFARKFNPQINKVTIDKIKKIISQ